MSSCQQDTEIFNFLQYFFFNFKVVSVRGQPTPVWFSLAPNTLSSFVEALTLLCSPGHESPLLFWRPNCHGQVKWMSHVPHSHSWSYKLTSSSLQSTEERAANCVLESGVMWWCSIKSSFRYPCQSSSRTFPNCSEGCLLKQLMSVWDPYSCNMHLVPHVLKNKCTCTTGHKNECISVADDS